MRKGTNTGFNGITERTRNGKTVYQAYLAFNGMTSHIGTYKTLNAAVKARFNFITNLF